MPARCFLALDVSEPTLRLLAAADTALLQYSPDWAGEKWVAPGLRHVTVSFIGPLPEGVLPILRESLAEALTHMRPFEMSLDRVLAIPQPRRATMLWAEFRASFAAQTLAATCADALTSARLMTAGDHHPFRPHITLARARRPRSLPADALQTATGVLWAGKEADRSVSVRCVRLLASTLTGDGPLYETLADIPLGPTVLAD